MKNIYHLSVKNLAVTKAKINSRLKRNRLKTDKKQASLYYRLTQILCAVLIASILTTSVPAAPKVVVASAGEIKEDIRFDFLSGSLLPDFQKWIGDVFISPSTAQTSSSISQIQILPGAVTVKQGEQVVCSAIAYDSEQQIINGVAYNWSVKYLDRELPARPLPNGKFSAIVPGRFLITAESNGVAAETTVTVESNPDAQLRGNNVSKDSLDAKSIVKSSVSTLISPTGDDEKKAVVSKSELSEAQLLPDNGGWGDGNWNTGDDPGNTVGNPPGTTQDGGAGSGNFQFAVPILSLEGRGIDLGLGLAYNSRLWNKSGSQLTYDIDRGFPGPGWSLGFGKMMDMGAQGGSMIVEADGTRHGYSFVPLNNNTFFRARTVDGSFIDYTSSRSAASNSITSGNAHLSNGTEISYGAPNEGAVYPTQIKDKDGNYISITYVNNQGPAINTITDTMGRVITFQYDGLGRLISIKAPGLDQSGEYATLTLVRFHYKQLSLNYAFAAGTSPVVRNPAPWVLDAIYYPATQTGYWFGDTDSYSAFGMLTKVVDQRGMTWSAGSETQGVVTPGQTNKQSVYNYPLTATNEAGRTNGVGLTDAPTYNTLTESWDGMDTAPLVTTYNINQNSTPRTTIITHPNGLVSKQYANNLPNQWNDGLLYQEQTLLADGTVVGSSTVQWEKGDYESTRPIRVESTDERGQLMAKTFSYGPKFNQVVSVKEYGYSGSLIKETRTAYDNRAAYVGNEGPVGGSGQYWWGSGRHIFNLTASVEVYDGLGSRVKKTDFEYDNVPMTDAPGVIMYDSSRNPNEEIFCIECGECIEWYDGVCLMHAGEYLPNGEGIFHGNITKITNYSDAQTPTGAIEENYQYDVTGNKISASTSCCEQTSYGYSVNTQYAFPESVMRGAADPNSPHRISTSSSYNFNTGLLLTSTNADGRTTSLAYNSATLHLSRKYEATGAYTEFAHDATAMSSEESIYTSDAALAGKSRKFYNGAGQLKREEALAATNVWDIIETKYNIQGEVWKKTRPYRSGEAPQWMENKYDSLGRLNEIVEPDGSKAQAFYNEASRPSSASAAPGQTTRSVDAWGRELWMRTDESGQLIEVVEPNANGTGSVSDAGNLATKYVYDALGKLLEVQQGEQRRYFTYDSLGRLTRQKLAEQTATINNAGIYVGAGHADALWSDAFVYDNRSNLIQKTDSRGVKTNFLYQINGADDPLNRLQVIWHDLSGPRDPNLTIHEAYGFVFEYMPTGDKTRVKKVEASGLVKEEYEYDIEGRVKDFTQTIAYRENYPMTTSYIYDSLGRITDTRNPAQYGLTGNPRKLVQQTYDVVSRLSSLKVDGQQQAGDISFNASNQTTSIKVGAAGTNQVTESYVYDSQTGLLTNQKLQRGSQNLLDLSYEYQRGNSVGTLNGKTSALTKIINNLDRNKDRSYEYDAVGRLVKATGGVNQTWSQQYTYDRYGNRTGVTAQGSEALRGSGGEAAVNENQQKAVGQNSVTANLNTSVKPPTATQFMRNAGNSVDAGRGNRDASAETPDLTDERSGNNNPAAERKSEIAVEENVSEEPSQTQPKTIKQSNRESVNRSPVTAYLAFDFDGDKKADFSTWNRANGNWTVRRSKTAQTTTTQLGANGNQIAPGDYDGDGKADEAVWNPETGVWSIRYSSNGNTITQGWGTKGDTIVPADYDGDGKTDIAVWRPSTGDWWIIRSSNNTYYAVPFGSQQYGDIPIVGDYDGDGKADLAIWRPGVYTCIQNSSNNQVLYYQWGVTGDVPVPGDYDGDGKTDLAVWRPSNGIWYLNQSTNGYLFLPLGSETAKDKLVPADYDGDGKADIAVWTPSTATWTVRQSATGTNITQQLGTSGELAVPSAYIRRSSAPKNQSTDIPADGIANLSYSATSNRITTSGFEYDTAGNQTRALAEGGTTWLRFEYDAANRLRVVKKDDGTLLQTFQYGSYNSRLMSFDHVSNQLTIYSTNGTEYTEYTSQQPVWTRSSVYLGGRHLMTITPNGQGGEYVEYNHPDRLGTRLVTNQAQGTQFEQTTLPFGTALNSESTGATKNRFTTYERSSITGLDFAVNRTYDSKQGRFTQVDPIGMKATSFINPQTLNLYNYCGNDPINRTDPNGLFWGAIGRFFKKLWKGIVAIANAVSKVLNNKWVQIGLWALDFFAFGLGHYVQIVMQLKSGFLFGLSKALKIANSIAGWVSSITGMVQMADMAIKGKFKDLGIILGIGLAMAPLSTFTGALKRGAAKSLFSGSFDELADLFTGAWSELKSTWHQFRKSFDKDWAEKNTINKKPRKWFEMLIPFYGNFCGAGHEIGTAETDAMGGLDWACYKHDNDMANATSWTDKWWGDMRIIGRSFITGTNVSLLDIALKTGGISLGSRFQFIVPITFGGYSLTRPFR